MSDEPLASYVAEDQLVGQCIMKPDESIFLASEAGVMPEWFAQRESRTAYHLMLQMYVDGPEISMPTLLEKAQEKKQNLPMEYVQRAIDCTPITNLPGVIARIKEMHVRREMLTHAKNLKNLARVMDTPPEETIGAEICALAELTETHKKLSKEQIKKSIVDRYRAAAHGGTVGLPTPWQTLNKFTGGLSKGQVTVFAGRGGVGKSMASATLAHHLGQSGISVGYLPFEDGVEVTWARIAGINGKYSTFRMDTNPRPDECSYAEQHLEIVMNYPIHMEDRPMTAEQIMAWAIHQHAKNRIKLLIVDAFKDIKRMSRDVAEDDQMSQTITHIARRLSIPVWISHHVRKKDGDNRQTKLTNDDIRGSANIVNDCRQLILLQNWVEGDIQKFAFEIAKANNGPSGMSIPMERKSSQNTWAELEIDREQETRKNPYNEE